jgi:hypothetical protein
MKATEVLREEVKLYIDKADDKSLRFMKAILEIEQVEDDEDMEYEDWDDLPKELRALIGKSFFQSVVSVRSNTIHR